MRSGWRVLGVIAALPAALALMGCNDSPAGDGEEAAAAAEAAPEGEPDIEPFEGTFTVDTARIPPRGQ